MLTAYYYEKGPKALVNQDAIALEVVKLRGKLCAMAVVCDGIGGLSQGEYASMFVTGMMINWFYGQFLPLLERSKSKKTIERSVSKILYECNRQLILYGRKEQIQLGTTMTLVLLRGRSYQLYHIGDSKAVLIQGAKKVCFLTKDDQSRDGALIKCIGSFPWKQFQKKSGRFRQGSALLLCSDGFQNEISEDDISRSFGKRMNSSAQMEKRLQAMGVENIKRGEMDNQSAILLYFQKSGRRKGRGMV